MTPTIIAQCEAKGLRLTDQRRVIAAVLEESDDHPDVEELYNRASGRDPRISLATVYRTVKLFEDWNLLEKHEFGDGRARYETTDREHHDHLITSTAAKSSNSSMKRSRSCKRKSPANWATSLKVTGWNCSVCR